MTEALLAYLHFLSILGLTVFMASEAALCRKDWMSAAVVERLARVDLFYLIFAACVLLSGFARTWWGMKGVAWYWSQPLLHIKVTLFAVIAIMSLISTRRFLRWRQTLRRSGALPSDQEVCSTRRLVMIAAHLLVLVLLAATLLARGVGTH